MRDRRGSACQGGQEEERGTDKEESERETMPRREGERMGLKMGLLTDHSTCSGNCCDHLLTRADRNHA